MILQNVLAIGVKAALIDIEVVNFIFLYFLGMDRIFSVVPSFCILVVPFFFLFFFVVSNYKENFGKVVFFSIDFKK